VLDDSVNTNKMAIKTCLVTRHSGLAADSSAEAIFSSQQPVAETGF
jgi:hypothetical protein